jgi:hypothetical protein
VLPDRPAPVLADFGELADLEHDRLDIPVVAPSRSARARLGVRGDDHLGGHRFGEHRSGPDRSLGQLLADFLDFPFVRVGFRCLLLQLVEPFAEISDLLLGQRPGVAEDLRLDASAGDRQAGRPGEVLPSQFHLDGGTLPAAGGEDVADVRGCGLPSQMTR